MRRETRKFHVLPVQRRQRNIQRSMARAKLWFYYLPLSFSLPSPTSLLKLPIVENGGGGVLLLDNINFNYK